MIALHYSFRNIDHQSPCDAEQLQEDSVDQVYLKFCDLTKFPEWLVRFPNLTHLNISCNAIERITAELDMMSNLNYLDLSNNHLLELPTKLFKLDQLRYLDVAGNFIETIPSAVKYLTNLEFLNFDRNFIMEIPRELAECTKIFQMSFEECERLFAMPNNLLMMPNLMNASFRSCNLLTIPSMISPKVNNLMFDGNRLLNCIPYDTAKFISQMSVSEFYMVEEEELSKMIFSQMEFLRNSQEVKQISFDNGMIANVPKEIEKVFIVSSGKLCSLKELCLRIAATREYSEKIPNQLEMVLSFPTAICDCGSNVFIEAFMTFFYEKTVSVMLSKIFCSKNCRNLFYEQNEGNLQFIA